MTAFASSLTSTVARQYDLFSSALGIAPEGPHVLERRVHGLGQGDLRGAPQRLCIEVFEAAEIGKGDVIIDVGFGTGEQDFLLSNAYEFARLIGFNISEWQVRYAHQRAILENLAHKRSFRLGEAERLPGVEGASVDRVLAIECAFYFERPRFYERAVPVLKPGAWWSWPTSPSPTVPPS
jgi:cyclopropane fatty-acyl-phospholipid synthase-like methyltransferase